MRRILVGVDGSEPYAQGLAQWELAELEYANGVLREMAVRCARRGTAVEALVESGPAAEMLANLAEARDADIVVVGHRGRGAVARALLGSVADRLVQISRRPVLILKERES